MTRISLLAALPLMLMLQGCGSLTKADIDEALANWKGENVVPIVNLSGASSVPDYSAASDVVAALIIADTVEQSSSSSSAEQVAYVPPPCEETIWRGNRYSCTGENLGPVE